MIVDMAYGNFLGSVCPDGICLLDVGSVCNRLLPLVLFEN